MLFVECPAHPPSSGSSESSIDNQTVSRHEGGPVGAKPQYGFGHFLDSTDSTDGMKSSQIILFHIHTASEAIDHLRVDYRRIDRVNADPFSRKFQCRGFRKADDGVFRCNVYSKSRESDYARD